MSVERAYIVPIDDIQSLSTFFVESLNKHIHILGDHRLLSP